MRKWHRWASVLFGVFLLWIAATGLLSHLHSGESFGPAGVAISIVSGFALLFFAFSGLWMYFAMWRGRGRGGKSGVFWR